MEEDCEVISTVTPKQKRKSRSQWCSAINCSNGRYNKPGLSFFRFPKDKERCHQWVLNCGREDLLKKTASELFKSNVLCTLHFEDSQFQTPKKLRLNSQALPTLFQVSKLPPRSNCKRSQVNIRLPLRIDKTKPAAKSELHEQDVSIAPSRQPHRNRKRQIPPSSRLSRAVILPPASTPSAPLPIEKSKAKAKNTPLSSVSPSPSLQPHPSPSQRTKTRQILSSPRLSKVIVIPPSSTSSAPLHVENNHLNSTSKSKAENTPLSSVLPSSSLPPHLSLSPSHSTKKRKILILSSSRLSKAIVIPRSSTSSSHLLTENNNLKELYSISKSKAENTQSSPVLPSPAMQPSPSPSLQPHPSPSKGTKNHQIPSSSQLSTVATSPQTSTSSAPLPVENVKFHSYSTSNAENMQSSSGLSHNGEDVILKKQVVKQEHIQSSSVLCYKNKIVELKKQVDRQRRMIKRLQGKQGSLTVLNTEVEIKKMKDLLKERFSGEAYNFFCTQMEMSIKERRWNDEDKSFALSLYHASPKAYGIMKNIFRMPTVGTLRRMKRSSEGPQDCEQKLEPVDALQKTEGVIEGSQHSEQKSDVLVDPADTLQQIMDSDSEDVQIQNKEKNYYITLEPVNADTSQQTTKSSEDVQHKEPVFYVSLESTNEPVTLY